MFPRHPNLLPAYFDDDPKAATLGTRYVRKPLYSREGANVELVVGGSAVDCDAGPTARKGSSARRSRRCRTSTTTTPCSGSWIAAGKPCGLSVREDESPITKNTSRFLPHAIIG